MKLLVFVVGALVATVLAEKSEDLLKLQGKRQSNEKQNSGQLTQTALKYLAQSQKAAPQNYNLQALSYDPQSLAAYSPQSLQYSPQSAAATPPHLTYGFAPQQQQQQQQIQYVSQPAAYEQPKAAHAQVQKLAPIHFSPASEVSSFKFTSPLVTYSNQGVLSQLVGNAPEIVTGQHPGRHSVAAPPASHYSAAPQKNVAATQQQYQQYSEEDYAPAPQKLSYSQAPQQYEYVQVPQQQVAYSAQPQKLTYSQGAQPSQSQYLYDQGPQQFGSASPNAQQLVYSSAQPQASHSPSQQQFVYSYASPQASQSNTRSVYAVPHYRTRQSSKPASSEYYSQ